MDSQGPGSSLTSVLTQQGHRARPRQKEKDYGIAVRHCHLIEVVPDKDELIRCFLSYQRADDTAQLAWSLEL